MAEVRGGFDVLFDQIVAYLEAYSTTEEAVDTARKFIVKPDYYRNYTMGVAGAYVFLTLGPITPERAGSSNQAYFKYSADYILDLIVEAKGNNAGAEYSRADKEAGIRLRYLIQQVLEAIHGAPPDMGLIPAGSILNRPMMRFDPLPPEMQLSERPVIGARMTLTVGLAWEPAKATGTALEEIKVDTSLWSSSIT
jgi:hypothetical protein